MTTATAAETKETGALPLVIWMNAPSPYQEDLFRALTRDGRVDLRVVYDAPLPDARRRLGWQVSLAGYAHQSLDASMGVRATVRLARSMAGAVHIVNGLWAVPRFLLVVGVLLLSGVPALFIYSEASVDASTARGPRRLLSQLLKGTLTRATAVWPQTHILAISRLAERQFGALGFPRERIYPFGYFSSRGSGALALAGTEAGTGSGSDQRLVFVGQLIRRKGVDVLLAALEPLWQRFPDLSLDVLGEGPLRGAIEGYTRSVPQARITLLGARPSDDVARHVAACDLLVLPSRFDGWGMVVNEALMVGTPVLVTDRCGAADLVRHGRNGYVAAAGSVTSLRDHLIQFLGTPRAERESLRQRAAEMGTLVDANVAALYLVECVFHVDQGRARCPVAPWNQGA